MCLAAHRLAALAARRSLNGLLLLARELQISSSQLSFLHTGSHTSISKQEHAPTEEEERWEDAGTRYLLEAQPGRGCSAWTAFGVGVGG